MGLKEAPDLPAVYGHRLAGDVAGGIGAQESHQFAHVLGVAHPSQGHFLGHFGPDQVVALISAAARSMASWWRDEMTRRAPSAASASAIPRPRPRLAALTSPTRPSRFRSTACCSSR